MKVQVIPARKRSMIVGVEKIGVAAYVRVSTLNSEQEDSFESQREHFTTLINSNPEWELTEVYTDQGKSGLSTSKRTGFNRMMSDAKRGKFKILLVKSISRFARNTLTTIQSIRELNSCGVDVRFEKEALSSTSPQTEFLLTIMASIAQQESMSLSQNIQIGLRYKMQRGEWHAPFQRFLGYDRLPDGSIVINEEQAETVRHIFALFLGGMTIGDISRQLEAEGRLTGLGRTIWYFEAIRVILKNIKYTGDVLIQLTYMQDVLAKKRAKNNGEVPQYFIRDALPPIIDRQTYHLAQGELMRRDMKDAPGPEIKAEVREFTRLIKCPYCGAYYNRTSSNNNPRWGCYNRVHKETCSAPFFTEAALERTVFRAAIKLYDEKPEPLMKKVPMLTREDPDDRKIQAASTYMHNVFANRVLAFLDGPAPVEPCTDLTKLVERMDMGLTDWTIHFYGGISIRVMSETNHMETPRRLHRNTENHVWSGVKGNQRTRRRR